ncbi:MAG: HAD-IC family P-type ATPase, partial [Candidatus Saccharimonadales bacterium]
SNEAAKVDNIVAFKPFTKQEVLIYAGSVQQRSNNILARAVTAEVTSNKLRLLKAKHVQEITGSGLEARINNKEIVIGRLELIQKRNITIPEQFKPKQITQTVTFIAINGELAGYITFTDSLRPGIKSTLITLAGLGVLRVLLVTTDHQTAATQFAKRLGITDIKAEAHPGDELHAMESIEERPVIFIGSGITDSTALTAADVGIIIGASGQTAASHAADVIIMKDDLSYAARAIILAKWSFHIIKQSVAIGVGISIALMLISVTGLIAPVTGAIIREIIDVIIILNALRPRMAPYAS